MKKNLSQILTKKPNVNPTIYAFEDTNPAHKGYLKIGFTTRSAKIRVSEQKGTSLKSPDLLFQQSSMLNDGSYFTDKDIHKILRMRGFKNPGKEWFECTVDDIKNAILQIRTGKIFSKERNRDFKMRPEQEDAVSQTIKYFKSIHKEGRIPKMLWNAKMRFGKTFAAYQLAKKMKWKKVFICQEEKKGKKMKLLLKLVNYKTQK